ncbi:unnamed protein product [Bathycoccus prasinos]
MWHISKRKTFCELYKLFSRYPIQEICTGSSQKEGTEKAEPQKSEGPFTRFKLTGGQSVHASIPVNQWRKETVKWSPYTMKDCPMLSKPWSLEKFEQRGRKALEYTWTPIEQELRNWESLLDEIIVKWENKTFAFIGDSNTEAQFTSFVCLLHVKYGTSLRPTKDKYSSQYDSNGISMVFLRSDRLVEKVNCRSSCNKYQFKRVQYSLCLSSCKQKNLVSDRVSSNIISFMNVNKPDVLIINTGAHYTRGKHGTEHLALQLFETAVNAIIEWLTRIDWNIAVFWRLSHINLYSHGDWNTFGNCSADRPELLMMAFVLSPYKSLRIRGYEYSVDLFCQY